MKEGPGRPPNSLSPQEYYSAALVPTLRRCAVGHHYLSGIYACGLRYFPSRAVRAVSELDFGVCGVFCFRDFRACVCAPVAAQVDAGADFVVTQFFYDTEAYLGYVKRCRGVGIDCPIIPGIMAIQVRRIVALGGSVRTVWQHS